jgi:hypothetical protein
VLAEQLEGQDYRKISILSLYAWTIYRTFKEWEANKFFAEEIRYHCYNIVHYQLEGKDKQKDLYMRGQ